MNLIHGTIGIGILIGVEGKKKKKREIKKWLKQLNSKTAVIDYQWRECPIDFLIHRRDFLGEM